MNCFHLPTGRNWRRGGKIAGVYRMRLHRMRGGVSLYLRTIDPGTIHRQQRNNEKENEKGKEKSIHIGFLICEMNTDFRTIGGRP